MKDIRNQKRRLTSLLRNQIVKLVKSVKKLFVRINIKNNVSFDILLMR